MAKKHIDEPFQLPRPAQLLIAAGAGVLTGMANAVRETHSQFREKLLEYWKHDDGSASKIENLAEKLGIKDNLHNAQHEHGQALEALTTRRANGRLSTKEYLKLSHEQKDQFVKKLDTFAEEHLGIATKGAGGIFEGTWQRFKYMGGDTRKSIAFNTAIATTVGIAGTLMFFNSINTHNKLGEILDKQKENDR